MKLEAFYIKQDERKLKIFVICVLSMEKYCFVAYCKATFTGGIKT